MVDGLEADAELRTKNNQTLLSNEIFENRSFSKMLQTQSSVVYTYKIGLREFSHRIISTINLMK